MIELRPYQTEIAHKAHDILRQHGIVYLALEVRVGKTLCALKAADLYGATSVLFLTKKKAISSIQSDAAKLQPSYALHVTNFEQAAKISPGAHDIIIIDEAHAMGAFPKPSKRTIEIRKICATKPVIMLSGTPSPESYSQLYHQLSLSDKSPFDKYRNFYAWAKDFVAIKQKRIGAGQLINDYSNADGNKIWAHIKHLFIRFTQEDAGFVAPVDEKILVVDMSEEAKRIYKELEKQHIYTRYTPHSGREIVATVNSGADLINKLAQISSGTLIFDENPKGIIIDWSKASFIVSYFAGKKIAIFYRFKAEFELLKSFFPKWTESPEQFNAMADLTFLGQIQSAREGVNLATAGALVMYNIDFSATSYFQARARIQSKERKGSAPMYWIFSGHGIEQKIYAAVTNKTNFTYSYYRKHGGTYTERHKKSTGEKRLVGAPAGSR